MFLKQEDFKSLTICKWFYEDGDFALQFGVVKAVNPRILDQGTGCFFIHFAILYIATCIEQVSLLVVSLA